jgi:hypothetical protein
MSEERIHQSIIRNGNHFIRLDYQGPLTCGMGWVLIDGPWYEIFKNYKYDHFRVLKYQSFDRRDRLPRRIEYEELIWEKVWWHPGTIVHPRNLPWHLQRKWSEVLNGRKRQGWRLLPDGRLPAFFNRPDWIEDEWTMRMVFLEYVT